MPSVRLPEHDYFGVFIVRPKFFEQRDTYEYRVAASTPLDAVRQVVERHGQSGPAIVKVYPMPSPDQGSECVLERFFDRIESVLR